MTGSFASLLSLTLVFVVAYAVADGLKSAPIYGTLLENLIKEKVPAAGRDAGDEKTTFAVVVQHGASIAGKRLKEIDLPQHCLPVAVQRGEREIIPPLRAFNFAPQPRRVPLWVFARKYTGR